MRPRAPRARAQTSRAPSLQPDEIWCRTQAIDMTNIASRRRVTVPCGRASERDFKQGAMAVGARTMQDGGAMLGWSRQQVRYP